LPRERERKRERRENKGFFRVICGGFPAPLKYAGQAMTPSEIEAELERLHAASFSWALACCGRKREEALDVLQMSYLKLLDGRARFEGHSSFKTFLFGVIRRTASEGRRRRVLENLLLAKWRRLRVEPRPATGSEDDRVALRWSLSKLARRQREVLELVFYQGLTVEEAADALAISVGSARVHYGRGKRQLARRLAAARGR